MSKAESRRGHSGSCESQPFPRCRSALLKVEQTQTAFLMIPNNQMIPHCHTICAVKLRELTKQDLREKEKKRNARRIDVWWWLPG